jgi:pantoate--beta-alanine ligase
MKIINTAGEMQRYALEQRAAGKTIAFVPTMGFLHDGHLSLLKEGRKRGDLLVLSVFVNPVQFGENEDLDAYPRDHQRDCRLAEDVGVDVVYLPTAEQMYPEGYLTYVNVEGITEGLCGLRRPGHFRGVTTVVTKLFNIVQPNVACFGAKDFQQLAVIRRMVSDLNMPIEIVELPIFREVDGLALSSRNVYLNAEEREQALVLSRALKLARKLVAAGETDSRALLSQVTQLIEEQPLARIDYARICHDLSLEDQPQVDQNAVLLLAVYVGKTRLLDNGYLVVTDE